MVILLEGVEVAAHALQVGLGFGVAAGGCAFEDLEGLLALAVEPEGGRVGIVAARIVTQGLELGDRGLVVAGLDRVDGFVDIERLLVGDVVEVDAQVTGVTLVVEDVVEQRPVDGAAFELLEADLPLVEVGFAVDDVEDLAELAGRQAGAAAFEEQVVDLVAELVPGLAAARELIQLLQVAQRGRVVGVNLFHAEQAFFRLGVVQSRRRAI